MTPDPNKLYLAQSVLYASGESWAAFYRMIRDRLLPAERETSHRVLKVREADALPYLKGRALAGKPIPAHRCGEPRGVDRLRQLIARQLRRDAERAKYGKVLH